MAVESSMQGRAKVLQLSFEDFLEALVRVAAKKALPTDEECKLAGVIDAGEFMLRLHAKGSDSSDLMAFLEAYDALEPHRLKFVHRALQHLLCWLLRLVGNRFYCSTSELLKLTSQEVSRFRDHGGICGASLIEAARDPSSQ